jgi:hypothetical protein
MARVITAEGKITEVKNLRWLLTHRKHVVRVEVTAGHDDDDCELVAIMGDGGRYECHWGSRNVCRRFLAKLISAPLSWFGKEEWC